MLRIPARTDGTQIKKNTQTHTHICTKCTSKSKSYSGTARHCETGHEACAPLPTSPPTASDIKKNTMPPACYLVYSHAMSAAAAAPEGITRHMDPRRELPRVFKAPEAAVAQSQHRRRARAVLHTVDGDRGRGFTPQRRQVIRFSSRLRQRQAWTACGVFL